MSAAVVPLDPMSVKGIQVSHRMTVILTEIHDAILARRTVAEAPTTPIPRPTPPPSPPPPKPTGPPSRDLAA